MSMYNRLFTKILDSSIWLEPLHVRVVWITLLAAMDEDGFCAFACPANVARRAGVSEEQANEALACLCAPDPNSSDPDNEGRRLERIPGGYLVLNALKYKAIFNRETEREQTRKRVERHRRKSANVTPCNAPVTPCNGNSKNCNAHVTQSDTESLSESESKSECVSSALPPVELPSGFPKDEDAAVACCMSIGVPEAFIRTTWQIASGRGGRDARDVPIRNFASHAKAMFDCQRSRDAEKNQSQNSREMRTSPPAKPATIRILNP